MSTNTATRRSARALMLAAVALSSTACMTHGGAKDMDARFEAGWRPSKGYCTFGAETARLAAWCAEVNFGREGLVAVARAVNEQVLASAGGEKLACTDHVAQVRAQMADYADYQVREIYSCDANPPVEDGRAVCHVSLMVTSASGTSVVLDNGHVLDPGVTGGVAPLMEFAQLVDHHWTGDQPDWVALASR